MCSAKCSLSLVQIKFSLTAFNAKARVHSSLAHSPQLVSCREWLGRKLGQSRRRVGVGIVGIARSQVGAASGTEEEHKISYEELGRYGIDESDYADSMRAQVSDEHQTSSSKAVSKSKTQKRKAPYEVVDKTKDDPEDSEDMEFTDDAEVEGNDWCTYLILSNDKLKTYLGVTANLTRRLRQHNGELAGGAKSARGGRPWSLVCTIRGFGTRSEACQFEWRLRNFSKGYLAVDESLAEEIPANYQGSHIILRRWAAFKKVHETMDDWKHMRVEWH